MQDTMLKRLLAVLCLLLIAGSCAYLTGVWGAGWRLDLTDRNLYTLTDTTRGILKDLQSPVRLQLYYSRTAARKSQAQMRQFNTYARFIEDLLMEYQNVAPAMVTVETLDPQTDSDEERDAKRYELNIYQLSEEDIFVFGLVLRTETGTVKTIPFFAPDREQLVEYDITKLIVTSQQTEKPSVGVLSSLPLIPEGMTPMMRQMLAMRGQQAPADWHIVTLLRDQYDVRAVEKPADVEGLDMLMVVHPKDLADDMLYAVDQYVMNGGSVLAFVDPFCSEDNPPQDADQMAAYTYDRSSSLDKLTKKWGVRLVNERFAGDLALAANANGARYLAIMNLNEKCVNPESVVTGKFNNMEMIVPGILLPNPTEGIDGMTLLSTTATGGSYHCSAFELNDPAKLQEQFSNSNETTVLGYQMSGAFESNFPDGPPKTEDGTGESEDAATPDTGWSLPHLAKGAARATVMVFSDVDFIGNRRAFQSNFFTGVSVRNQNANIVLNAAELLTGGPQLIEIRSRGGFRRPFKRVDKLEAEADAKHEERNQEIQARIDAFNGDLEELQNKTREGGDRVALQNDVLKEKKRIEREIVKLQDEQRLLRQAKRRSIESLGMKMKLLNLLAIPLVISLYSLWLTVSRRMLLRARWEARREE